MTTRRPRSSILDLFDPLENTHENILARFDPLHNASDVEEHASVGFGVDQDSDKENSDKENDT